VTLLVLSLQNQSHEYTVWTTIYYSASQANGSPPCLNGDIAIQWEWSNFDPSQNQNPLTDYDKTLHNWLRPRAEEVTQNFCQSVVRVRPGKYVKCNTKFIFIFSRTRLKWHVDGFWRTMAHNTLNHARMCLLWSDRWLTTFRGLNSPKTVTNRQKIGHFIREVDTNEEW